MFDWCCPFFYHVCVQLVPAYVSSSGGDSNVRGCHRSVPRDVQIFRASHGSKMSSKCRAWSWRGHKSQYVHAWVRDPDLCRSNNSDSSIYCCVCSLYISEWDDEVMMMISLMTYLLDNGKLNGFSYCLDVFIIIIIIFFFFFFFFFFCSLFIK